MSEASAVSPSTTPGIAAGETSVAAPPPAAPALADPAAVWSAILHHVSSKPILNWVESLEMATLEGGRVRMRLRPGQRAKAAFIRHGTQQQRLADLFKEVLGRPVSIEWDEAVESVPEQPAPLRSVSTAPSPDERNRALNLPMVRQVMEVFDASLIDVRPERATAEEASPADDATIDSAAPPAPTTFAAEDADGLLPEELDDV